jgi:hypothetical protein
MTSSFADPASREDDEANRDHMRLSLAGRLEQERELELDERDRVDGFEPAKWWAA